MSQPAEISVIFIISTVVRQNNRTCSSSSALRVIEAAPVIGKDPGFFRFQLREKSRNSIYFMVRPERFELPTPWFVALYSIVNYF